MPTYLHAFTHTFTKRCCSDDALKSLEVETGTGKGRGTILATKVVLHCLLHKMPIAVTNFRWSSSCSFPANLNTQLFFLYILVGWAHV